MMLFITGMTIVHLCAIKFRKESLQLLLQHDATQIQSSEAIKTSACLISPQLFAGLVNNLDNFEAIITHSQCSMPVRVEALLTLGAIRVVGVPFLGDEDSEKTFPEGLNFWRRVAGEWDDRTPGENETDQDAGNCSSTPVQYVSTMRNCQSNVVKMVICDYY